FRVSLRLTAEGFAGESAEAVKKGEKPMVVVEITLTAFVELQGLSAPQTEVALNVDVPNQLVPLIRHHLHQFTMQANLRPVILPFISFQARPVATNDAQSKAIH